MKDEIKLLKRRITVLERQVLNINNAIRNEIADSFQKINEVLEEANNACICKKED
jgi:hypothetical protein